MWELAYKESWMLKNWCFWTVVLEKTLESPLDCKEFQPVHPKDQSWIFIGRTDVEAEILWPPDVKNWPTEKDPDAGKNWRQEEKGRKEDEMVGCHHLLNGHWGRLPYLTLLFFGTLHSNESALHIRWPKYFSFNMSPSSEYSGLISLRMDSIQSAKTSPGADRGSDNELLIAKFRLKLKKVGEITRLFRYDLNQISNDYTVEVRNRFKGLGLIE